MRAVLLEAPEPPSAHAAGVPDALDQVCLSCLAKRPEDRYPSAAALADDLARFLAGDPLTGEPPPPPKRSLARALWGAGLLLVLAAALVVAHLRSQAAARLERAQERAGAWLQLEPQELQGLPAAAEVAALRSEVLGVSELAPRLRDLEALALLAEGRRAEAAALAGPLADSGADRLPGESTEQRLLAAGLAGTAARPGGRGLLLRAERLLAKYQAPALRRWWRGAAARLFLVEVEDPAAARAPLLEAAEGLGPDVAGDDPCVRRVRLGLRLARLARAGPADAGAALPGLREATAARAPLPSGWVLALVRAHAERGELPALWEALASRSPDSPALDPTRQERARARLCAWGAALEERPWVQLAAECRARARRDLDALSRSTSRCFLRRTLAELLPPGRRGVELLRLAALLDPRHARELGALCQRHQLVTLLVRDLTFVSGSVGLEGAPVLDDLGALVYGLAEAAPSDPDLLSLLLGVTAPLHNVTGASAPFLPLARRLRAESRGVPRRQAAVFEVRTLVSHTATRDPEARRAEAARALALIEEEGLIGGAERAWALAAQAKAQSMLGAYEPALASLEASLAIRAEPGLQLDRARLLIALGRLPAAQDALRALAERAVREEDRSALRRAARLAWGTFLERPEALEEVDRTLELARTHDTEEARRPRWTLLRASCYLRRGAEGDLDRARALARAALEALPLGGLRAAAERLSVYERGQDPRPLLDALRAVELEEH